jgi:hypothetical protein
MKTGAVLVDDYDLIEVEYFKGYISMMIKVDGLVLYVRLGDFILCVVGHDLMLYVGLGGFVLGCGWGKKLVLYLSKKIHRTRVQFSQTLLCLVFCSCWFCSWSYIVLL